MILDFFSVLLDFVFSNVQTHLSDTIARLTTLLIRVTVRETLIAEKERKPLVLNCSYV